MGKGKPIQPKRRPENERPGCNCPIGCEINEIIGDLPPTDAVLMVCSNDKCTFNGNLHRRCFEALEASLIRTIQSSMGRTRDWTDEQCRRAMWDRVYDLIYRHCKCFCGGHLKKAVDGIEPPNNAAAAGEEGAWATKKKKNKAGRKDLPKLVLDKTKVVGSSSGGGCAAPSAPSFSSIKPEKKVDKKRNDVKFFESPPANTYIPGLVITDDNIDKKNTSLKNGMVQPQAPAMPAPAHAPAVVKKSIIDISPKCVSSSIIAQHAAFDVTKGFAYTNVESRLRDMCAKIPNTNTDSSGFALQQKNGFDFERFRSSFVNN